MCSQKVGADIHTSQGIFTYRAPSELTSLTRAQVPERSVRGREVETQCVRHERAIGRPDRE